MLFRSEDTAAVRQAMDRAAEAAQKIGTALYEKARAESGATTGTASAASAGGTGSDDEVVDAEIVDEGA